MHQSAMTVEDMSAVAAAKKKSCCKCGTSLATSGASGYCGTCRWLLRCDGAETPSDALLAALGLFITFDEKQKKEPLPVLDGLAVQNWPEVHDPKLDRKKRKRGQPLLSTLDSFFATL